MTTDIMMTRFYIEHYDEQSRLIGGTAQGLLEFDRTQAIIRAEISPQARILDVGGGTGVHAAALTRAGHHVVVVDPIEKHVEIARGKGVAQAETGDARCLKYADSSFDAVILAGPLYHLGKQDDRLLALSEAKRVCRKNGSVFAATVSRMSMLAPAIMNPSLLAKNHAEWISMLQSGTGMPSRPFPGAHFHTADELLSEMRAAGFRNVKVVGVEGLCGLLAEKIAKPSLQNYQRLYQLASEHADSPGSRDFSNHLMGIART